MASGVLGGGANHLEGMMFELRELGVECVAAVGPNGSLAGRLRARGFDVVNFDSLGWRVNPLPVWRLATTIHRRQISLLHLHGSRAGFFGAMAAVHRLPVVYTVHGLSYRKGRGFRHLAFAAGEAIACRGADRVISVSRTDLDDLIRRRFVGRGRGVHIPNAVDFERFARVDRDAARQRLGLQSAQFVVGTVSRLVPQKAVGDLVDAVRRLRDVVLVVVGDGPQRRLLEEQAGPLRQQGRVQFLGGREDVAEIIGAFDVFALSSLWEGEPIALLEAMAAGVPIVATDTTGSREALGKAGLLVEVGSPQSIADGITQLRQSESMRSGFVAEGRAAVAGRTYRRLAESVVSVYREVVPGLEL